jgi:AAHS family benzoate transporter-like MFS transporter
VLGRIADHTSTKWTIALAFLAGGCAIFGLSFVQTQMGGYLLVVLAGIGTISSSLILTGFLTGYYPAYARGSAPGWALSFARLGAMAGPLIGGYAASIGLALRWHFGIFAIVAFVATIAVALIPETRPRRVAAGVEPIAPAVNAG